MLSKSKGCLFGCGPVAFTFQAATEGINDQMWVLRTHSQVLKLRESQSGESSCKYLAPSTHKDGAVDLNLNKTESTHKDVAMNFNSYGTKCAQRWCHEL
jgi:hypothetical protein